MKNKKACKNCKTLYEGEKCPGCGNSDSTTDWKGRVIILDPEKSEIAKKIGIKTKGDYAIKTR